MRKFLMKRKVEKKILMIKTPIIRTESSRKKSNLRNMKSGLKKRQTFIRPSQ